MSVQVICEHAAECAETGADTECWHCVAHVPLNYKASSPVPPCDCQAEMEYRATGKMCRCEPV